MARQVRDWLLADKFPGQEERLSVSLREVPKVEKELKKILAQEKVPADISGKFFASPKAKLEGNVVIAAEIRWRGKLIQSIALPVKIVLKKEVLVAAVKVPKGRIVTAQDVAVKLVDSVYLPQDIYREVEPALGQETKVPLYPGTFIASWMLRDKPAVHRGETVTVVAWCDNVELKVPAVAQQDAYLGHQVRVKADTGKVISGLLCENSVVKVNIN